MRGSLEERRSPRGAFATTVAIEHGTALELTIEVQKYRNTSNYRNRLLITFEGCKTFHMVREGLALHFQTQAIVRLEF